MKIKVPFRHFLPFFVPFFIFAIFAACTPLVGAMLDKPKDGSTDGTGDTSHEFVPLCSDAYPCPEGYVCVKESCGSSYGECVREPESCTGLPVNLVCGCNTQTYLSECEMLMAGQTKMYDGECITASCGWDNRSACGPGNYCEGICGDSTGVCLPVPAECAAMPPEDPVCGCPETGDSVTYMNHCERIMAGAWFEHPGECGAVTGCMEGDPENKCGPAMFCEGDEGACGTSLPGWCADRPEMCEMVYEPVCGCNDMTYGNDCERQRAGVWRNHRGECRGPELLCTIIVDSILGIIDEGCPGSMFCELPPDNCPANVVTPVDTVDIWGVCVDPLDCSNPPLPCVDEATSVCGCSSVQYENDCARRNAGDQVACCGDCMDCRPIPPE
jgi:hypothetical protein